MDSVSSKNKRFAAAERRNNFSHGREGWLLNTRNTVQEKLFPSLDKEGWTRPQEKYREASFVGAAGVVRSNYRLSVA